MTDTIHKFESAGLGKAPFKFTGMNENLFTVPGCPEATKPGGTCDFCGTGIRYEFHILSADGKHHKVGSNCIEKVGDAGLRKQIDPTIRRHKREQRQAKAYAEAASVSSELDVFIVIHRDRLAALPDPQGFVNRETKKPLTLLDWAKWRLANCGTAGRAAALRQLRETVNAIVMAK
jgi:hypothetical protein